MVSLVLVDLAIFVKRAGALWLLGKICNLRNLPFEPDVKLPFRMILF